MRHRLCAGRVGPHRVRRVYAGHVLAVLWRHHLHAVSCRRVHVGCRRHRVHGCMSLSSHRSRSVCSRLKMKLSVVDALLFVFDLQCPVGTFQSASGQPACQVCPTGSYVNVTGVQACLPCPAGSATSRLGQIECEPYVPLRLHCLPLLYHDPCCFVCDAGVSPAVRCRRPVQRSARPVMWAHTPRRRVSRIACAVRRALPTTCAANPNARRYVRQPLLLHASFVPGLCC